MSLLRVVYLQEFKNKTVTNKPIIHLEEHILFIE